MKKLLLLTKMLLAAALLCVGQNAWGETITFDFKTAAASGGITAGSLTKSSTVAGYIAATSTAVYYPTQISSELKNYFAFQYRSTNEWSVDKGRGGLWSYAKSGNDENFSICNLQAGDIVTITLQSGEIFFSSSLPNATWDNSGTETTVAQWESLVSNRPYKIKGDGKLDLQAKKYSASNPSRDHMVISKIVIERSYTRLWGMDFITLANNLGAGSGKSVTKSGTASFDSYYNITDAGFNTNFGVNNDNWQVRANGGNVGLWPYNISGTMAIQNLPKNAFVTFWASSNVDAGTNAIKIASLSGSNYYTFQIVDEGVATFTPTKSSYIYSVGVYKYQNEIVGTMNYTTNYSSAWNTTPVWINAGETAYYKFINYNNTASANLFENWYLFGATEASENVVIFGPNHSNTGTHGTYTSKPTFTMADLNGATVELTTTLTDAGDGTYTLTTTGVTTKADGSTKLSPNLVYQQTGLTASKLKLYVSVEKSWLALQEEAVVASISSYGWATFSSENALDFSKATEGLEAYMITGHEGNVVTKSQVTGTVPAGKGLLLKGAEGDYNIPVVANSETNVSENKMKAGTGESVSAEGGKTKYVLGVNDNGTAGDTSDDFAEFQKITETSAKVAKGKAYLEFDGVLARSMRFSGDITGINQIDNGQLTIDNSQPVKRIVNGKLVIEKNGVKYNAAGAKLY